MVTGLSDEEKAFVRIVLALPGQTISLTEKHRPLREEFKEPFSSLRRAGYLVPYRDATSIKPLYLVPTKECLDLL